jgi:hypothetical protein
MAVSDPTVRAVFWAGGSPGRSAPILWIVSPELTRMQVISSHSHSQTAPGISEAGRG